MCGVYVWSVDEAGGEIIFEKEAGIGIESRVYGDV